MKVAMPIFGNRVSPRFDCANSFLVVTAEGQEIVKRRELYAADWTLHERIARMISLGVDVLVCGGIDRWSFASLHDAGITIYRRVTGTSDENFDALLQGKLIAEPVPVPHYDQRNVDRDQAPSNPEHGNRRNRRQGRAANQSARASQNRSNRCRPSATRR